MSDKNNAIHIVRDWSKARNSWTIVKIEVSGPKPTWDEFIDALFSREADFKSLAPGGKPDHIVKIGENVLANCEWSPKENGYVIKSITLTDSAE